MVEMVEMVEMAGAIFSISRKTHHRILDKKKHTLPRGRDNKNPENPGYIHFYIIKMVEMVEMVEMAGTIFSISRKTHHRIMNKKTHPTPRVW